MTYLSVLSASEVTALEQHRQQFPALANKAYFNFGGQGPMPQGAIAAIQAAHEYTQQQGPFSNQINAWATEETNLVRAAIASELQVPPETITLTESVSVGCNIALWGIDWHPGDHILLSDCEHPGIVAAVQEIGRRFGVEFSTCPLMETLNQGDPVAVLTAHLRPTTRMVVISHILWNTGQVLPLAEIVAACHAYPGDRGLVWVMVDAAQSVGVLPLNLAELDVDFYAFTGHKWLCGAAGLGGLYIRPEAMAQLSPVFVGWRSVTKNQHGHPTGWLPDGRRYEVATSDFTLFGALRAAIATHQRWGTVGDRYQRICTLSQYLWQRLSENPHLTCLRTAPPDAGLVSFRMQQGNHNQLAQTLEKQGFLLRTILDPDCIRACVHYFTLESEIDRLVEAIRHR